MKISTPVIHVSDLSFQVTVAGKKTPIISDITLLIHDGDRLLIQGPSGSGKSTLLACLSGLLTPSKGSILIDNNAIYRLNDVQRSAFMNRSIGFMFQDFQLLEDLSVLENVIIPGLITGSNTYQDSKDKALSLLNELALSDKLSHYPHTLSGGEKQRVAFARALINTPRFLFCDEPTANLDTKNTTHLIELLQHYQSEYNMTLVIASHDSRLETFSNKTITLRDGTITK